MIRSISFLALASPLATATFTSRSPTFTVASLTPLSPLTALKFTSARVSLVTTSYTVLSAASITPPVAPKITAAPVVMPNGSSNVSSGSFSNSMPVLAHHLGGLAGGEDGVDVRNTGHAAHFVAAGFHLLRGARHYRNDVDILGLHPDLVGVVGLRQSAEHLLRALAGRQMRDKLGIEVTP